jgi:hypothetical protein
VPIPPPTTIDVPRGLNAQAVEVAVVAGILNSHPPLSYDPNHELPATQFDDMLRRDLIEGSHGHSWSPGAREGDVRYATVDTRGHYLRVAIHMSSKQLRIEIVESRNLLQEDGVIHKKVVDWLGNLEAHIRKELDRMAAISHGDAAPPGARAPSGSTQPFSRSQAGSS